MNVHEEAVKALTRRHFFRRCQVGVGSMALASLLAQESPAAPAARRKNPMREKQPHFTPRAKRVIFLHMAGSPSQLDMFDYKPKLNELSGKPCPDSLIEGQRFAFIKGHPKLLGCPHTFKQYGESGKWFCNLLPGLASIADDLTFIHSMTTDQFNHAPAQLFLHTGTPRLGYPAIGSWLTYGLGTENQDLPGFVVLVSGGKTPSAGKSVWGSGFLPSVYQGVQCRTQGDPVLYVSNPDGMDRSVRRRSLDAMRDLNEMQAREFGDPEILTRIAQYELAYRMQMSVPQVMDISKETKATIDAYGAEPGQASFANNCLLARRLVEQGVRFVQLYDWGWDLHGIGTTTDLLHQLPLKCKEIDRPITALLKDLKQRGLLEDTLVVWGGEFGRTAMNEERNGSTFLGRDHHPHAFTMFMAGGGVKHGATYGATDEFGYFVTEDKMTVHDLQATLLHLTGLDAFKLSFPHQGLQARLIGPSGEARVHHKLLA